LAPIAIPLAGEVPISLATFAVMLSGAVLGSNLGTRAVLVYIILGMMGIPVFANYASGSGIVFGMTGGYIIGYLPLAFMTGLFREKLGKEKKYIPIACGALLGNLILYVLGTVWFIRCTEMPLAGALAACVFPFIPGDLLKTAAVCLLTPRLRPILENRLKNEKEKRS
ncbi:MAG: biotin transporter BioY, partial [Erysipelotrichaceae bacterium]|nr:biotin transporter BioY [Erysipelotrichaceae bacterium]